jgi:glycosyltransferase involved in cell wall biosynthesis
MMMGLPCISTNCAGSDEAITDGENGLLVPVCGKDELVCAMLKLIEDRELRDRIANNAKASAEKYKTENVIELWTKAIEGDRFSV